MPITGQTALTTILAAKELKLSYQPILLIQLDFSDGDTVFRACSENLDITEEGFQYDGHNWKARVRDQSLGALQSVSDNGIVQLPQITIQFADADKFLWTTYELADLKGFKGAKMTVFLVFWDPDTNTFSSDKMVKFVGICNPPNADDQYLNVTASNILNLSSFNLPVVNISRRCRWIFPTNRAQRILAALDPDSDFYECGYSPDIVDGDGGFDDAGDSARGNLGGPAEGGFYTDCDYTREACIARLGDAGAPDSSREENVLVKIEADQLGRHTGRFSGITFDPPAVWRSREYTTGQFVEGTNNPNEARYTQYFPMTYGTSFVSPPVMNVIGNANTTKFEVVLGVGPTNSQGLEGPVHMVIVNDFIIPFGPTSHDPSTLGWYWITDGDRDGRVNRDTGYDGKGDPYGSLIAISIIVPRKVQESGSVPNIRVLFNGPAIRQWSDGGLLTPEDATKTFSTNAAWILLDLLTWCSLALSDVDIESFFNAAATCDVPVTYTDLTGDDTATHPRYQLGLSLRERRTAAEVINNVLASMKGMLAPNAGLSDETAGKLQLFIKQTLADQQPEPVEGSNDDVAFESANAQEEITDGFLAYHFDESNILRRGEDRNTPSTFKVEQRPMSDTPNRVGVKFQDEDFSYTDDTLVIVDAEDIGRSKRETSGGLAAEGLVNHDQGKRCIQTQFAEQYRGNPRSGTNQRNDSGGTWIVDFEASFRAVHLRVGHIIGVTYAAYGLDRQLFRVISLSPTMNCERIHIRAQWHEDDWYLDRYGQQPDPKLQYRRKQRQLRPPFGWSPNMEAPLEIDALYSETEKTFALAELYEAAADGTTIAKLRMKGKEPVNSFSTKTAPPYAPEATVDNGGTFPAGVYYFTLCAQDDEDKWTAPSFPLAKAVVAEEDAPGTITIPNIYWQDDAVAWKLYGGTNPNKLSLQASGSGTPDEVAAPNYKVSDESCPDVQFDHLEVRVAKVWHSGIFGSAVTQVPDSGDVDNTLTPTQLDIGVDPGFDCTGRIISIIGRLNDTDDLPQWNFEVASNAGSIFTFVGVTDFQALGVKIGDVVVCRTQPDEFSTNTIGDSRFVNAIDYFDPPINIIGASNETPIVLTLGTANSYTSGDKAYIKGVQGNTNANGVFGSITIPSTGDPAYDRTHVILDGAIGNGDYSQGGTIQLVTNGLRPDEEIGRVIEIIGGTGRGIQRDIVANTTTTYAIDGEFGIVPDATTVFIVRDKLWLQSTPTTPSLNSDPEKVIEITQTVDNFLEQVLYVQAFSMSADKRESIDADSPGREIYVYGGPGTNTPDFDKATFNIAVIRDLEVDDDVAPHYIVRRPGTVSAEAFTGVPASCVAEIKFPSAGADVIIDIIITKDDGSYSGSIFNQHDTDDPPGVPSKIVLPAGATEIVIQGDFKPDLRFDEFDILTINVDQIGTDTPGKVVAIVLKWTVD